MVGGAYNNVQGCQVWTKLENYSEVIKGEIVFPFSELRLLDQVTDYILLDLHCVMGIMNEQNFIFKHWRIGHTGLSGILPCISQIFFEA